MRRWIGWAGKLYPRAWRDEYGPEFEALLDDVQPGWRVLTDVLRGGIAMQLKTGTTWLALAAATGIAGAIVAAGASYAAAPRYVSSAVLRIVPRQDPIRPARPESVQERAADHMTQMRTEILSRGSLAEIVQKPSLDLYKAERQRIPMEDVVQQMRGDIRIEPLPPEPGPDGLAAMPFRISFAHPDQRIAQGVTRELIVKFVEQNMTLNRNREWLYTAFWQDAAKTHGAPPPPRPPSGPNMEVMEPATLPTKPAGPNRGLWVAAGLGAGLVVGLIAAASIRRPRAMALLAGGAAAGCVLAFGASFLLPERYISTAVMRITSPQVTENPLDTPPPTPVAGRLAHLTPTVLSTANLAAIIQKPALDLYSEERARLPMEQVVQRMRDHDIRIALLRDAGPGAPSAFQVSFSHPDRRKAQAVVRELVTSYTEINVVEARSAAVHASPIRRDIEEHKAGENLEVLDPASFPESPASPNRAAIAGLGSAAGLLLGGTLSWRRREARMAQL